MGSIWILKRRLLLTIAAIARPHLHDAPQSENGNACCGRSDEDGAPCRGERRESLWCRRHLLCRWLLVSARRSETQATLYVLWESPPTRLCALVRTTTPKETVKIVFMMQNQAIAPTNQISIWRACEIELTVIYTYASFSLAVNASKVLEKSGISTLSLPKTKLRLGDFFARS